MRTSLRLTGSDYDAINAHLFRPDRDEYGAVLLAGIRRRAAELTLLVREVHLLDDTEFTSGTHGYRQTRPEVLARLGNRAANDGLTLVTCHSHPGATTRNRLSRDDLEGHRRVFPHLLDIVNGSPVAGIAFGQASVAGEVWDIDRAVHPLDRVQIVGPRRQTLYPFPPADTAGADVRFDRQARLFGAEGQAELRRLRVAVIGLGGGGSMVSEQLAHLGVGEIVAVDYDCVETHNLSRIVGATKRDAELRRKKVDVARDHARRIDPEVRFRAIDGDLADSEVAKTVGDCDFIVLCTDTITSRLVANAIAHSQLVPMIQIGAKVDLNASREIESVYVAVRPVLPGHGCLDCAGLIDAASLQREAATAEERCAQNYLGLPEVVDPSVITLNGIAASAATNTLLMSAVGLADSDLLAHRLLNARDGTWLALRPQRDPECRWCGRGLRGRFASGDNAQLPTRLAPPSPPAPRRRRRLSWDRLRFWGRD